jgi:hypothetical protein
MDESEQIRTRQCLAHLDQDTLNSSKPLKPLQNDSHARF